MKSGGLALPTLDLAVQTLASGGFVLQGAERNPGYALIHMHRIDEFGVVQKYSFGIAERKLSEADVAAAKISSGYRNSNLVLVGAESSEAPSVEWLRFINLFGGPISSSSPLDPDFVSNLLALGRNKMPSGLTGKADDLFEEYCRAGLEFLLGGRVLRYGQDRLFEKRPDGLALPTSGFRAIWDAKAYADGYPLTADSIRQFKDYINEFSRMYQAYLPRINSFILISGTFDQQDEALTERSKELQSETGVPLSCLSASVFGEMISLLLENIPTRKSINWSRIFSDPVASTSLLRKEIVAIKKDLVIPPARP